MNNLQPGDILLWRVDKTATWKERLIGWGERMALKEVTATGYQYYHAATVSQDTAFMYSSQPPKIDLYPVPDPLPDHIEVYRLIGDVSPAGLAEVFKYMESRRGKPYPWIGVLSAGWLQGNLEFCSQLTVDGWFHYPLALCENVRFVSPDDIADTKKFCYVSGKSGEK